MNNDLLNKIIIKIPKNNNKNELIIPLILKTFNNINKNNFEPRIIFNSLSNLKDLDYSSNSTQRALSFIKRQIDDPAVIAHLQDKGLSPELRSRRLSSLLEDCQQAMVAAFPIIRDNGLTRDVIQRAKVDDEYANCDSSLKFGMALDFDTPTLFGVMFHELTHLNLMELGLLPIGVSPKDTLEVKSIHEFASDLGTFAMYAKTCNGNEKRLNDYIDGYFSFLRKFEGEINTTNFSFEPHHAARVVLKDIIKQAREKGIKLTDLFPELFDSSLQTAKNSWLDFSEITFTGFTKKVCTTLNKKNISSNGDKLVLESQTRLPEERSRILSSLERFITTIELPDIRIKTNTTTTTPAIYPTVPAWVGFKPEFALV